MKSATSTLKDSKNAISRRNIQFPFNDAHCDSFVCIRSHAAPSACPSGLVDSLGAAAPSISSDEMIVVDELVHSRAFSTQYHPVTGQPVFLRMVIEDREGRALKFRTRTRPEYARIREGMVAEAVLVSA